MAHRSNVPKFGNWESEDNVPYTFYFEKARKGRQGGTVINPNNPEENSDALSLDNSVPPAQAVPPPPPPPQVQAEPEGPQGPGQGPVRPTHEQKISNESDLKQFAAGSPSRPTNRTKHQAHGSHGARLGMGDHPPERIARGSAGSEHSIDKSQNHPQARMSGRGIGSPSWEGRVSRDTSQGTPGRSRLGGASQDELPTGGSTVPKFGAWNEDDPASADGYTHIFNKVREERQAGARNGPGYIGSPYRPDGGRTAKSSGSKICCFPWGRR